MTAQFSRSAAQFARRTITGRAHERHDLGADRHDGRHADRQCQRSGAFLNTIVESSLVVAYRSSGKFAGKQLGQFRVGVFTQPVPRGCPWVGIGASDKRRRAQKLRHRFLRLGQRRAALFERKGLEMVCAACFRLERCKCRSDRS